MKSKLEENISLFDGLAKNYDFGLFQFWLRKFHKPVFNELSILQKAKILDLSCGTGELLLSLHAKYKDKKGLELVGLDVSEEMLKIACRKLPKIVKFVKGDAHHLPFKDNSFDYIISTEAFHHYYNQQKAMLEMMRVVRKGGKLIVVDVNFFFDGLHRLFERLEPGCVKINNKEEMKLLFKDAKAVNTHQKRNFFFAVMTVGTKIV